MMCSIALLMALGAHFIWYASPDSVGRGLHKCLGNVGIYWVLYVDWMGHVQILALGTIVVLWVAMGLVYTDRALITHNGHTPYVYIQTQGRHTAFRVYRTSTRRRIMGARRRMVMSMGTQRRTVTSDGLRHLRFQAHTEESLVSG